MDQPLGYAVGTVLEVQEAIDTLMGKGPEDFVELCLTLGAEMVVAGKKAETTETARQMLLQKIEDGSALHKLAEFVKAQGGDASYVYEPQKLPRAAYIKEVTAEQSGYIRHIDCDEVGICSLILGGGRETKESEIDLSVGLVLAKKVGDYAEKGDVLVRIYGNDLNKMEEAAAKYRNACHMDEQPVEKTVFIKGIIHK
jgi:pyrimidine-nucleoside phosphorylase